MHDDGSGRRDAVETELQATGRRDLAAGVLCCLGNTRRPLH